MKNNKDKFNILNGCRKVVKWWYVDTIDIYMKYKIVNEFIIIFLWIFIYFW